MPLLLLFPLCVAAVQMDPGFRAPNVSDGRAAGRFSALQPDGRILADDARVRYHADGTRDATYTRAAIAGTGARVVVAPDGRLAITTNATPETIRLLKADGSLDAPLGATFTGPRDFIFQRDGKLLVAAVVIQLPNGRRTGLARFNRDGSPDPTFDAGEGPAGGEIEAVAEQADGKILVSGFFSRFDNAARPRFVRLNANGTADVPFAPNETDVVTRLLPLADGKILAFESIGNRVVRFNADGSVDRVLGTILGGSAEVEALAVQADGRVLVGGGFTAINGVARRNLARLNTDGSVDATFDASAVLRSSVADVLAIAVQADGKILFMERDNSDRLLRLNPDGSVDAAFAPGTPKPPAVLNAVVQSDGRILLVGTFTTVDGVARPGLARLRADGSLDSSFVPDAPLVWRDSLFDSEPLSAAIISAPDGSVIVTGTIIAAGSSPRSGLARFTSSGALDPRFALTLNEGGAIATAVALPDRRIVIGGDFSSVNGSARSNLAALQPDGTLDPVFGVAAAPNGAVQILRTRPGGGVFAAGNFTSVGAERRNRIAAFTDAGASEPSFVPAQLDAVDRVTALVALADGSAIIAGPKVPGSGQPRTQLRRLKATGEIDPGFVFPLDANAQFTALAADAQGRVLAAFTVPESFVGLSTPYHYVQRFLPSGALDLAFNTGAGPSGAVTSLALAPDGSAVLLTGSFTRFDDLPAPGLARLLDVNAPPPGPLFNISTRSETAPGGNVLTAGFVISGTTPKTILLRAAGPTLGTLGVANALADPTMTLFGGAGTVIATNDNWSGFNPSRPIASAPDAGFNVAFTGLRSGAFPLHTLESAVVITLPPGAYTAQVAAAGNPGDASATGITLIEAYDANGLPADRRLANISSRGTAGPGNRTLIAGFVIRGSSARTVLVRAVGPGLAAFNVPGALADPTLAIANSTGATIASNDDWSTATNKADVARAATQVGAFTLAENGKDSALLVSLAPGNYTALVSGANNASGVALVEVYEVP